MRRRWPHAIISWTRLLSGRFNDPLVGRDLLAVVVLGCSRDIGTAVRIRCRIVASGHGGNVGPVTCGVRPVGGDGHIGARRVPGRIGGTRRNGRLAGRVHRLLDAI